jgi:signal transduction histidine kinase
MTIEYASALLLLSMSGLFAGLWLRLRASLRAVKIRCGTAERQRAELAAARELIPIRAFRFAPDLEGGVTSAGYAAFLAGLADGDAARLETARRDLQGGAVGFSVSVAALDGTDWIIEGRCAAGGEVILWLLDGSATAIRRERDAAVERTAMLREMIDAIPMPVWRRDGDGEIVEGNRAYASALALTDDVSRTRLPALAPWHSDLTTETDGDIRNRGRVGHLVIGGTRRLIEITEVVSDCGGTIGFAADRTEAESAQNELSRHIDAHGEVLEGIHAGVAIYGPDRRLKYFNAAFAGLWGMDEEWLAGEPTVGEVLEWLRERRKIPERTDFPAYKCQNLKMFTNLIEPRREMLHLPDGRTLQLSISPHPLGGLVFMHEDVTDYLALECSFNTLAQVQRATLDHLFEGIAVFGADGRLKLHNSAYLAIWGFSEADVAGEPHVAQLVEKMRALLDDGADWNATKEAVIDRIAAQVPASGLLNRCDGSLLQTATVPLPDGKVLLTYLDVSDTARVEQALREKNEALETADRLKSEFIANVSYELRTPLNAVIGFAQILTNQYFGTLNARQLDYSRAILDSAQQLAALISDILDLATIEAGYLVLEESRFDVARMLEAVAALGEERARSQGLGLLVSCSFEVGTIEADERRLKQALFNLLSNAIKFTPPGGSVVIEAERQGGDLLLSVADTGIGIAPVDQARVFGAFERGVRQTGAGLGLSLVKKLIELHGGTVGIESAPQQGTRVLCRLPAGRRSRRRSAGHRTDPRKRIPAAGAAESPRRKLAPGGEQGTMLAVTD